MHCIHAAYSYICRTQCTLSVCLLITQMLTDRDAVKGIDSCGHKKPCIRWGQDPPWEKAILGVVQPTEKYWESAVAYAATGRMP